MKARGWSQSELARRVGVSRQAVSLWLGQSPAASVRSHQLVRLSQVLGVPLQRLVDPLPCSAPEERRRLQATLLWDRLFADLDDFAIAVNRRDLRAVGRLVEVYGLYATEKMVGKWIWSAFPRYRRYLHPARRRQLEALQAWRCNQT